MAKVIAHEFGKEDREHVRRFTRLMNICEHERHVHADPIAYLRVASDEIERLRKLLDEARRALP